MVKMLKVEMWTSRGPIRNPEIKTRFPSFNYLMKYLHCAYYFTREAHQLCVYVIAEPPSVANRKVETNKETAKRRQEQFCKLYVKYTKFFLKFLIAGFK